MCRNYLDNYRYRTVTDYNCLGIDYGLSIPISEFQKSFLIINYGITVTDFHLFGMNYDDRYRYPSRL